MNCKIQETQTERGHNYANKDAKKDVYAEKNKTRR